MFQATRKVYKPVGDVCLCMFREFEFDLLSQDHDRFTPLHQLASIGDFHRTQLALEHKRQIGHPVNTIPRSDLIPDLPQLKDISLMGQLPKIVGNIFQCHRWHYGSQLTLTTVMNKKTYVVIKGLYISIEEIMKARL